ncbi:MAG: hypothetical protein QME66_13810 [Candidatus Eisenbacteria bacterium]|nr:hypothetical protein [Candidatus Eisenbacteria bacterium]
MGMDMKTRRVVTRETRERYRKARKKGKVRILDEFVDLTGYNRCYAARVLRNVRETKGPVRRVSVGGRRGRKRKYPRDVFYALRRVWAILRFPCGKRLVANMGEIVSVLIRKKELRLSKQMRRLLVSVSASTADRLLTAERRRHELKGRSGTKPGSLLKHKIPICTFADWDDARVGFLQVDLVQHEGGNPRGDFCQTLSTTDVATGWTEIRAVRNKAQLWVFPALEHIRREIPFPIKGINSDSGSEFINAHLFNYCIKEKITFTRCRENKKNDNCYVEQKNYTAVRQTVGYYRYDTEEELELLNRLYSSYRLYANFFQPQMKLIEKIRDGSKIKKRYDHPRTPYARVLASREVSQRVKEKLKEQYAVLNPAGLQRDMLRLEEELFRLARSKTRQQVTQDAMKEGELRRAVS